MYAQITLTVAVAKRIIAEAIFEMSEVQDALSGGKLILKGGTTVSALSEKLGYGAMRISGRVSKNGTKSAKLRQGAPHSTLIEKGSVKSIDETFSSEIQKLKTQDVVVIGANALDSTGQTALMLGSPLGGEVGKGLSGLLSQGCKVIIACGYEKLIPTSIQDIIKVSGIAKMDWSMGMSVGFAPLYGDVVTEKNALERLANIKATVIACGGVDGGEGSTTLVLEGEENEVKKAIDYVLSFQNDISQKTSMYEDSKEECKPICEGCKVHRKCAWRDGKIKINE